MSGIFKIRKYDGDEPVDTDRYLITYADLVTLLLGLFVILYVTAQVDESKYKAFSQAFSEYFKSTNEQVLHAGGSVFGGQKKSIPEPVFRNPATKTLNGIEEAARKLFKNYVVKGDIEVNRTNEGIVITLREKLLFKSGSAEIEMNGLSILDSLGFVLKDIDKLITVDGHTDSRPIKTFVYESNWHLSIARSLNVAYKLMNSGVPESDMVIRGFGAERPVADNSTDEGRSLNRRVEITISELPPSAPSTRGYIAN